MGKNILELEPTKMVNEGAFTAHEPSIPKIEVSKLPKLSSKGSSRLDLGVVSEAK